MPLNIVLLEPEIPNNTGNIGRLSLASGCHLHLVKPYGFELSDKHLKRAGLDYWQHVTLFEYDSKEDFFEQHQNKPMAFFSSHGSQSHWNIPFEKNLFLIFGKESTGFDNSIADRYKEQLYQIPIMSPHIRSLNLANAVSVVVYEGLRQLNK